MWRARPIFISSTFVDMQAERDYLRTRVFPELEERLRARRHNLEWVDLRVGVATASRVDEHIRELHVLKVCLDEVRRCRPFLIVLLGDRYGWVPPEHRIRVAAEEAREGFSADVAGRSVTDLEIDFGVLSDPDQQPRSIFYFRDPLPYADMPANVPPLFSDAHDRDPAAADRVKRLAALKQRIEKQLPDRVRHYAAQWNGSHVIGLEAWGKTVVEDIWSALADEIGPAADTEIPWQQAERDALEDFVDDRARDFVGRQKTLGLLIKIATGLHDINAACIIGDPGSGKSALFGELFRRLKARDVFLLAHAPGASIQAISVDSMLRRWVGELAGALEVDAGLADDANPDTVDATFARLLAAMAQRQRVVLLIDALDQFETTMRARYLTWLPRVWPANARLLTTAIPGTASKALTERFGIECLYMPPLDAAEARDIVLGICRRYHREFEPKVVDALLAKTGRDGPAWANPLWLVLAVEELNLLDADDFARVQRAYEGEPAERLLALMIDIVEALPGDIAELYFYVFVRAEKLFGPALLYGFLGLIAVGRGGWRESDLRSMLPHVSGEPWDELKFAQLRRLFRGQLRLRGVLAQWDFNHGQVRPAVRELLDAANIPEKKLHLLIARHLLQESKSRPDDPLHISETMVHLLGAQNYEWAAAYYGIPFLSPAEQEGATRVLVDAISAPATGTPAMAARDICRLLQAADPAVCAEAARRFLFTLGGGLEQRAPLDSCLVVYEAVTQTFKRLLGSDPGNADWQRNLSLSLTKLGRLHAAQGNHAGALGAYRDSLAIMEPLARSDPDDALRQHDLTLAYESIGFVQMMQGDLAGASKSYRDRLAIAERLTRSDPGNVVWQSGLSTSFTQVGNVHRAQGDHAGALASYCEALAISERLAHSDPANAGAQSDLSRSYQKVGQVQRAQGDLVGALNSSGESLAISERLARSDPANTEWQRNLSASHDDVGNVRMDQRDFAGALNSYRDSQAIRERLARSDPGNADWQHDLSVSHHKVGGAQLAQNDIAGALASYRQSLAVSERLARSNPDNAVWQYGVAIAHVRIASVFQKTGEMVKVLVSLRPAQAIMARLAQLSPDNAGWRRELAWIDAQIAQLTK